MSSRNWLHENQLLGQLSYVIQYHNASLFAGSLSAHGESPDTSVNPAVAMMWSDWFRLGSCSIGRVGLDQSVDEGWRRLLGNEAKSWATAEDALLKILPAVLNLG